MANVMDIANWFLSHQPMTHKKLQKLCYYAQAWYCALYDGTPLFTDEIQAWVHGPVVTSLYPAYVDYKWMDIPQITFDSSSFDEKTVDILEAVYEAYGDFDGDQLESISHTEKPWIEARGDLKPWEPGTTPISLTTMREFYRQKYDQDQND